jgi:hypothetical protein
MKDKQLKEAYQQWEDVDKMGGDAFKILGFGLVSYRNVLKSLTITFFLLTMIFYPVINLYKSGSGINTQDNPGKYSSYSIANLGYSTL